MSYMSRLTAHIGANLLQAAGHILSDEQVKDIRGITDARELAEEILRRGAPFSTRDMMIVVEALGGAEEHNFTDESTDDVLDKYAEYIENYEYTYKPEAQQLDPNIDPNEHHIGPMAQDIEQVNPACIKETEDGIKTVDTGRLALMNAGAIAALKRQLDERTGHV